jgi:flavin-binding protein dodecin
VSVYRVTDLIGTSAQSWEDAASVAITAARGTLRDIRVADVVAQDIHVAEDGGITYRTSRSSTKPGSRRPTHRSLSSRGVEIAGSLTGSIADSNLRKPGWWFGRISGMIACPGDRSPIGTMESQQNATVHS